jgi:RNA-directed DNA polymerase
MKLPLNQFLTSVKASSDNAEFVNAISVNARALFQQDLPLLLTLGSIAKEVDIPYKYLDEVVYRKSNPYKTFQISKRSGGKRSICVPDLPLMKLQKWIHQEILLSSAAQRLLSKFSTAYAPNSSHIKNAELHVGAELILKLDVSSFFESISERQVYLVFRELSFRPLMAFSLARLCTRLVISYKEKPDLRVRKLYKRWNRRMRKNEINSRLYSHITQGHLPQGAPTSPMLSNLVCRKLDEQINAIASENNLTFSRYADDITLSGPNLDIDQIRAIYSKISKFLGVNGLKINRKKTRFLRAGCRKTVTGININGDKPRVPREYKDRIKQELFFIDKLGIDMHLEKATKRNKLSYLLGLRARIIYVKSVENELGEKYLSKFDQLFPSFDLITNMLTE